MQNPNSRPPIKYRPEGIVARNKILNSNFASNQVKQATKDLWDQHMILYGDKMTRSAPLVPNPPLRTINHVDRSKSAYDFVIAHCDDASVKPDDPTVEKTVPGNTDNRKHTSNPALAPEINTRGREAINESRKLLSKNNQNKFFVDLMKKHNIRSTFVSGGGNGNCLINALFQHASGRYNINDFGDATKEIREKLRPQLGSGWLYSDSAHLILPLIREKFKTDLYVCFFQVNEKGLPYITSFIGNKTAKPVVIWDQGNHYTNLVGTNAA